MNRLLLLLLLSLTSCYDEYTGMILSDDQIKNYNLIKNKSLNFSKHYVSITETNEYGDILLDNGYILYKIYKDKYIFQKQKIQPQRIMEYSEYLNIINKEETNDF